VRLVLEYCDQGTMRELLTAGCFKRADGKRDLAGIIATALDVARAMVFLHENQIVHADLKARNVGGDGGGLNGWVIRLPLLRLPCTAILATNPPPP